MDLWLKKDDELLSVTRSLYQNIYVFEVYTSKEITMFKYTVGELERRGYQVDTGLGLNIYRNGRTY